MNKTETEIWGSKRNYRDFIWDMYLYTLGYLNHKYYVNKNNSVIQIKFILKLKWCIIYNQVLHIYNYEIKLSVLQSYHYCRTYMYNLSVVYQLHLKHTLRLRILRMSSWVTLVKKSVSLITFE